MAGRKRKKFKLLAETIKDDTRASTGQPNEQGTHSELPTEILELIISQLTFRDNIRASAVCRLWHSVATSVRKLRGSRLCYAKDGWLLLYKPGTQCMFFYCPYTQEKIKLPRREFGYQIVAFSAAPTSPSCILFTVKHVSPTLVAISTCHPGANEWTTVNYPNRLPFVSSIWNKLVFCNGLFYCLSLTGWLGVYNPNESTWDVLSVHPPRCPESFFVKNWWKGKFMAEHNGDIFVIYTCSALIPVFDIMANAVYLTLLTVVDIIPEISAMIGENKIHTRAYGLTPRKIYQPFFKRYRNRFRGHLVSCGSPTAS
ncbi:unnamed protein product [Fraxinus pennsylvanica]|uniref:F-box domain-containing protein n=1 Tax=Fraxinus pennsylvanica TaxID=56036 RepID=A0AAD2A3A0_9LAMI|nr:unnamed protein product [Fraxinus pennsylvanica]